MDTKLKDITLAYLAEHHVMTLATHAEGRPWASPVFYVSSGFDLYFISNPSSRHVSNLASDPRVAGAIHGQPRFWQEIRGLQLEGVAAMIPASRYTAVMTMYLEKFPEVRELVAASPGLFQIGRRMVETRFYHVRPSRFVYLDNREGFAARKELLVE